MASLDFQHLSLHIIPQRLLQLPQGADIIKVQGIDEVGSAQAHHCSVDARKLVHHQEEELQAAAGHFLWLHLLRQLLGLKVLSKEACRSALNVVKTHLTAERWCYVTAEQAGVNVLTEAFTVVGLLYDK